MAMKDEAIVLTAAIVRLLPPSTPGSHTLSLCHEEKALLPVSP